MELTIKLQLDDSPLNWDIQGLEKLILEKSREAARLTYQKSLELYEKAYLKWRCSGQIKKERATKKLSTLYGDLDYTRYRVWDPKERRSRYPLDEVLGLEKWQRETASFQKELIDQAVQRSYGKSRDQIEKQTGVTRSKMSTWRLIQNISRAAQSQTTLPMKWKTLALPKAPEAGAVDPCEAMGIDLDATYCRSWKTKKWIKDHAVRVAVLYRHKEKVGKKRWKLHDKKIVASGPGEKLRDFLERVTHVAITHYGLHEKTQVVVHGDGDPWIRRYAEKSMIKV